MNSKISFRKICMGVLLGLLLCLLLVGAVACKGDKPDEGKTTVVATDITFSENFEEQYEYKGTVTLPYGIALDAEGNEVSLDVTCTILQGDEVIASSSETTFDLKVGDYTARYSFQKVTKDVNFKVRDTVAPVINIISSDTGSMVLENNVASCHLPEHEVVDYSVCRTTTDLKFYSADGTESNQFSYNEMTGIVTAQENGYFVYTINVKDPGDNEATETVSWWAKDVENFADTDDTLPGNVVSSFGSAAYQNGVLNSHSSVEHDANGGNYFTEWLETFEGAEGVLKITTGFAGNHNFGGIKLKYGKPFQLEENKDKTLVIRMYMPDSSLIGSDMIVAGNLYWPHKWSANGQIIESALTKYYNDPTRTSITEYGGMVSGKWFNIAIPVQTLIDLVCADEARMQDLGSDWLDDPSHIGNYPVVAESTKGITSYLQLVFQLQESVKYFDFYIDSITLQDTKTPAPDGFKVNLNRKSIEWNAVEGAEYYNVYDEEKVLIATVTETSFGASELGAFESLTFVAVGKELPDSDPVTVTRSGLDLGITAGGDWFIERFVNPVNASGSGTSLTVTFDKAITGNDVDKSGLSVIADGTEIDPTLSIGSESGSLVFTLGQEAKRIEISGFVKVDGVDYKIETDILVIFQFGKYSLAEEFNVANATVREGAGNANLLMYWYDEGGNRIDPGLYSFADVKAENSTIAYDGSFTVNGLEAAEAIAQYPFGKVRIAWDTAAKPPYPYLQLLNANDSWADYKAVADASGMSTIVIQITGGTTLYLKMSDGDADKIISIYFADSYTFTKTSPNENGFTVVKTEGKGDRVEKFVVTFEDEEGNRLAVQLVAKDGTADPDNTGAGSAKNIAKYTIKGTQELLDLGMYAVTSHTVIVVTYDVLKTNTAVLITNGVNAELDLNETFLNEGVPVADVSWTMAANSIATLSGSTLSSSTAFGGSVTLTATFNGKDYAVTVTVKGSENVETNQITVSGIAKATNEDDKFYVLFQNNSETITSDTVVEYVMGDRYDYSGSIKICGQEIRDIEGGVKILLDSTGYYFQIGSSDVTDSKDYPEVFITIESGSSITMSADGSVIDILTFNERYVVMKKRAPAIANEITSIAAFPPMNSENDNNNFYLRFQEGTTAVNWFEGAPATLDCSASLSTADGVYYKGSIKICGVELTSLLNQNNNDFGVQGVRFILSANANGIYGIQIKQSGNWNAVTAPFNGYVAATLEFGDNTELFIISGDTTQYMSFKEGMIMVKNQASYLKKNVVNVSAVSVQLNQYGQRPDCRFYFTDDENQRLTPACGEDVRFNYSGAAGAYQKRFYYSGSIKICGIELSALTTEASDVIGTQYGTCARLVKTTDATYGDHYIFQLAVNNSLTSSWAPFNGYDTRTIEFGAGTMLMLFGADESQTEFFMFENAVTFTQTVA